MAVWVGLRWLAFVTYIGFFFTFPLGLLWDLPGASVGVACTLSVLLLMGWEGPEKILVRMRGRLLSTAEAPEIAGMVREYCRRIEIPIPKLAVIETQAINFAVFGFSRQNSYLVLTRGAIEKLSREQLSACLGREMTLLWHREVFCATWLSRFFVIVDFFASPSSHRQRVELQHRTHSFKVFLRQLFFYPLALFPAYVLGQSIDPDTIDHLSTKITRRPRELAESLRLMEALHERLPFLAPFSTRHLFLLTPQTTEPLVRVLFRAEPLNRRIRNMELLSHVTSRL